MPEGEAIDLEHCEQGHQMESPNCIGP